MRDNELFVELLTYIKRFRPNTAVIMMIAHGSKEICKESFERGANYYYDKPVDILELTKRVKDIGTMRKG